MADKLPVLDLTGDANDDWIKKAYPGGIEAYRRDEIGLSIKIQKEHDAKKDK